tara:strand:- start:3850 stop:3984 length:135 start_codon:yes stop_codon:yes gene_type:complete
MTNSTKALAKLINEIDAHKHKDELIKLLNDQVADDTFIVNKVFS